MRLWTGLFSMLFFACGGEVPNKYEALQSTEGPRSLELSGDTVGVHDPAAIFAKDRYFVFSTGKGILIKQSSNLRSWKNAGNVFSNLPQWVVDRFGQIDIWAPDVIRIGDKYFLYYSASQFGKNQSCIGLATNTGTDLTRGWRDIGEPIICSRTQDDWNAIDPNVVLDAKGIPWMSLGSFWSGIKMIKLDPGSGKRTGKEFIPLASRRESPHAVEAPYIVSKNGYYYLFVSFDLCCRGSESTYKTMVGRSKQVAGPYLDRQGKSMLDGGGSLVLQGGDRWRGPGHNSVLLDSRGDFVVYHAYDSKQNGMFSLKISELTWNQDWPIATPP